MALRCMAALRRKCCAAFFLLRCSMINVQHQPRSVPGDPAARAPTPPAAPLILRTGRDRGSIRGPATAKGCAPGSGEIALFNRDLWAMRDRIAAATGLRPRAALASARGAARVAAAKQAKWAAFGWHVQRVDGNDLDAVVAAFDAARATDHMGPRCVIFDTTMCKGVDFLEAREITHFVRVEPDEWAKALAVLEEGAPA